MKKFDLTRLLYRPDGTVGKAKVKKPSEVTLEDGRVVEEIQMENVDVTLGKALIDSVLTANYGLELEETMGRYRLFQKLVNVSEVELSEEEINNLKKYVNDRYEVHFVGQIVDMLDE
jgi:hypothetical protein